MKGINVDSGFIMQKKLVAVHTVLNKATGVMLFVLPLAFRLVEMRVTAMIVCAIATYAAIQEGHWIRTGEKRDEV